MVTRREFLGTSLAAGASLGAAQNMVEIHVSCSQPLAPPYDFSNGEGVFTIVAYAVMCGPGEPSVPDPPGVPLPPSPPAPPGDDDDPARERDPRRAERGNQTLPE